MATSLIEASTSDAYEWRDSDTLKLCHEISSRLDSLTDAINHLSAWRLEALQAAFMPSNFLTELTVIAAAISRCKSQVRMPVGSLLRQVQSLLYGSAFPSKLESELRGKIDLNRHMDQLRSQVASLEIQVSNFNNRRAELVTAKWERLALGLLAESRDSFFRQVHQDIVSYVKSLHGAVRALKQDALLLAGSSTGSHAAVAAAASAAGGAGAMVVSSKDAEDWAKRDRRLLTRAAAVVKLERGLEMRERKLKLAVQQLSDKRNALSDDFAREKSRIEFEFELRERALQDKLAEVKVARESLPPVPLLAASDLPDFNPEPGTIIDPSSAIEAPAPVAPWAVDQLETASRADDWAVAQRRTRAAAAMNDSAQHVSTNQVLSMWSNNHADASTSMYYSSDEDDSFLLDNNAAIQYVDRKQSLNSVREKANQRSSDILVAEQSLSEAEQQLKQASLLQTKSLDALAKQREARLALMNDKIMEQKYIEVQEQLERLKMKEADLLEQQNVLNNSVAAYEEMSLQLEEQKKNQASREQQLDEMDIDISRRMSQLKFRESEITRGMNELAFKRKNFDSDCLSERTSIEAERERLKVDMAALLAEMSLEKRRQELLRLEQEHRQNIMKDFEESNRLQEVRDELAQKEVDFQKHVEEASARHTIEIRARMEEMEVEVQERMQEFAKQMEAKVLELAAREKVLEGQERPIMLAKEMEDIIATCEAKVRRNDKETARLKAWETKLQYQSKELDLLSDTVTQQLGNDEMKKVYLGMQAQYKEKLSRLALAEKKGGSGVSALNYKAEELSILEDQIAVRERALTIAEKNAAAIQSVSMSVKQAQAKTIRQNMARRQPVISADERANDLLGFNYKVIEEHADESDAMGVMLPQIDPSARSSVVAEKALEDKRKQTSVNVSVPVAGSGSPMIQPVQHNPHKPYQVFNIEAAQNVVSAVMQMGFTLQDQETFTSVLVEKVGALLRSTEMSHKESSSKHFIPSYKTSEFDSKILQHDRADLEARERLVAKREQVLLAQAKEISERSRLLALAENEAKETRMKGLIAAEKLGRAHVQEVAAASSKLNLLADDVRGTNDALNALLSGVQALTDLENGHQMSRQIDKLDDDMQQLDRNARDLEIRGNRNTVSANILSLESPASPAPYKSHVVDCAADWRASPFAASLDDEEAALWDRLTLEQLEVLQGLYTTHIKALNVLMQHRKRSKRPDRFNSSESVDPAIISRVRALTGAVLHHNELARLSMKAMDRAASSSPTLSKVTMAAPNSLRASGRADIVQIVSSNAFIPSAGGCITSSSPVARRLIGSGNPDLEEIMGGSRRSAIRSVNFNASIREV